MSRREGKCQAGNSDEMNPTFLPMIESGLMRLRGVHVVNNLLNVLSFWKACTPVEAYFHTYSINSLSMLDIIELSTKI